MGSRVGVLLCLATLCGFGISAPWDNYPHLKHVRSFVGSKEQTQAVKDLVKRIVGDRSDDFEVVVDPTISENGTDVAIITSPSAGKIRISGTSGVAVAFGFNHYLKYFCNKQMSWAGDNLSNLPKPLPPVPNGKLELDAGVKYRYYQNVCTVSYSFVWWNWTRWEREIDWMAMNGINLPLAFTGQEAIWRRAYKSFGCTDTDLDEFFSGPAFLAWNRMGNIYKWGGPLPLSWINNHLALQHQILPRMKSLGMIPVLPAFAGHIPQVITKLYHVNASRLSAWSHFNCSYACTYFLEPSDPMFSKIGEKFMMEQTQEFGTNHVYNADLFNEMIPRSSDPTYLAQTSAAVFSAMAAVDDKAIWVMQSWMFRNTAFWKPEQEKALLTAVPTGRMLILDLFSESTPEYQPTHSYYGQPFIWCMLHNFGGNTGFYGKIETINKGPAAGLSYSNSTMVGTGITPEGINQNFFIYDLMLEVGFFIIPRNLTEWVRKFAERRYGSDSEPAKNVWTLLAATAYNDTVAGYPTKRMIRGPIVDRPTTNLPQFPRWYDQKSLLTVWDEFMAALPYLPDIETVRYDAVDITRQLLQYFHFDAQYSLVKALESSDLSMASEASSRMLLVLDDMESILLTDTHFLMGKWISDARALGNNEAEKDLYEFNARNQVTLWGPSGEIMDYASKQWASLMSQYYRPRWQFFIETVLDCITEKKHFNHKRFSQDIFNKVEYPFTQDRTIFPKDPIGDSIATAQKIYMTWRHLGLMNHQLK